MNLGTLYLGTSDTVQRRWEPPEFSYNAIHASMLSCWQPAILNTEGTFLWEIVEESVVQTAYLSSLLPSVFLLFFFLIN